MQCPNCNSSDVYVIDSRQSGKAVRRRKECARCKKRFSTIEMLADEHEELMKIRNYLQRYVKNGTEDHGKNN